MDGQNEMRFSFLCFLIEREQILIFGGDKKHIFYQNHRFLDFHQNIILFL